MTTQRGTDMFTAEEVAYLGNLPVVDTVTATRIMYAEDFKIDCLSRYFAGESPTVMFRRAGLDPTLIGAKRIERCMARWRQTPELVDKARCRMDGATSVFDGKPLPSPDELAGVFAGADDLDISDVKPSLSRGKRFDLRDLIIYQQVLHISELERELDRYRAAEAGSIPSAEPAQA